MKKLQKPPEKETPLKYLPSESTNGTLISMDEYHTMVADRPVKFNEEQVRFTEQPDEPYQCWACMHFYTGGGRSVCEILRLNPERSIPATAGCTFWTQDGETFPLINDRQNPT